MSWRKLLPTLLLVLATWLVLQPATPVAAATNYNNLIDDGVFDNYGTMSAAQIDAFLNGFPSSCLSTSNGFTANDPTGYTPTSRDANGIYSYGAPVSAGTVIFDAATSHKINPQVLLVTIEKEETLVSGSAGCPSWRYTSATGYGCTDSGTATHNYSYPSGGLVTPLYYINGTPVKSISGSCVNRAFLAGFSEQVIHLAWLLSFSRHRAAGESNFAIVHGSWNHCDDNTTCDPSLNIPDSWACYSGFMTQGTWKRCTKGSATFYDGLATIDNTSVHMDNGSTAALYVHTPHLSGNDHFDTIFINWFGTVRGTPFIRIGSGNAVYVLGANNNYYHVASVQMMKEYGYGTIFKTVDSVISSYLNGLTNSGDLPPIARFEDPAIYLVNAGRLHHFADQTILNTFGYSLGQEATLPDWIQTRLTSSSDMALVVKQLGAPEIYYVSSDKKSHITSMAAYTSLGSPVYSSQPSVSLSTSYVAKLPWGAPILVANSFLHTSDTNAYGFWDGSGLQVITSSVGAASGVAPDYTGLAVAINQLPPSANPAVGSLAESSGGTLYIIDTKQKFTVDPSQLTNLNLQANSFVVTSDGWLNHFTTTTMTNLVSIDGGNPVYVIKNGALDHIYSSQDFSGLGYSFSDVRNTNGSTADLFSTSPTELFKIGRLLHPQNTNAVYLVNGELSYQKIPSSTIFHEFGFNWAQVLLVPNAALTGYTHAPELGQLNKDGDGVMWLVDSGAKHKLSTTLQGASYYNVNPADVPLLTSAVLDNLPTGADLTNLVRGTGQLVVFRIENGQKRPFSSSSSFTSSGASWSSVVVLSAAYLATIPTGAAIN